MFIFLLHMFLLCLYLFVLVFLSFLLLFSLFFILVSLERSSGHKTHYCCYCGLLIFKLPRHLENNHGQEVEVARALSLTKKSKERRNTWLELARKDDYKVNIENIRKNSGKICVSRRSGKMSSIEDFVPCIYCKGFFNVRSLYKHTKWQKHRSERFWHVKSISRYA